MESRDERRFVFLKEHVGLRQSERRLARRPSFPVCRAHRAKNGVEGLGLGDSVELDEDVDVDVVDWDTAAVPSGGGGVECSAEETSRALARTPPARRRAKTSRGQTISVGMNLQAQKLPPARAPRLSRHFATALCAFTPTRAASRATSPSRAPGAAQRGRR